MIVASHSYFDLLLLEYSQTVGKDGRLRALGSQPGPYWS